MKVFISWSGDRSRLIGEIFSKYFKFIIKDCECFFSPDDVDKGTRWFSEISKELDDTDIGIVCLTRDNLSAPWLLFESGALAKKVEKSRLCTFLLDLDPADIADPLAQFNHTKNSKAEILKLLKTLNKSCDKPWNPDELTESFNQWWPKIKEEMQSIPESTDLTEEPMRGDRELLKEILGHVRADRETRKDYLYHPATSLGEPVYSPIGRLTTQSRMIRDSWGEEGRFRIDFQVDDPAQMEIIGDKIKFEFGDTVIGYRYKNGKSNGKLLLNLSPPAEIIEEIRTWEHILSIEISMVLRK